MSSETLEQMRARLKSQDEEKEAPFQKRLEDCRRTPRETTQSRSRRRSKKCAC
jgi:hypothetical protein